MEQAGKMLGRLVPGRTGWSGPEAGGNGDDADGSKDGITTGVVEEYCSLGGVVA